MSLGCRTTSNSPESHTAEVRWGGDIARFATMDATNMPPTGALLLAGSSSFRLWTTAQSDFPERVVINRGFGGSQMSDLLYYVDELVLKYRPADVFVYEGDNDIAEGVSPRTILEGFQSFARIVLRELPDATIHFVSIKPSPLRQSMMVDMAKANELIEEYAARTERVTFVDVYHPMLNEEGEPRRELFVADRLHLNEAGYQLWTEIIRAHLGLPAR